MRKHVCACPFHLWPHTLTHTQTTLNWPKQTIHGSQAQTQAQTQTQLTALIAFISRTFSLFRLVRQISKHIKITYTQR